jgi:hypothetical protein
MSCHVIYFFRATVRAQTENYGKLLSALKKIHVQLFFLLILLTQIFERFSAVWSAMVDFK